MDHSSQEINMFVCNCQELKSAVLLLLITGLATIIITVTVQLTIMRRRERREMLDAEGAKYLHGVLNFMYRSNLSGWKDHSNLQLKDFSRKYNPNKTTLGPGGFDDDL